MSTCILDINEREKKEVIGELGNKGCTRTTGFWGRGEKWNKKAVGRFCLLFSLMCIRHLVQGYESVGARYIEGLSKRMSQSAWILYLILISSRWKFGVEYLLYKNIIPRGDVWNRYIYRWMRCTGKCKSR